MLDVLIIDGRVVDGTGNPWFFGDIGIKDGKVCDIGELEGSKADEVISASKMIVCPGFTDIHTHSDLTLLVNPQAESKIRQGVTTEVIGNCGMSAAPIRKGALDNVKSYIQQIAYGGKIDWDWETFSDYVKKLREVGPSINVAPLVGHGVLRINVMEFENRSPTDEEMADMKKLLTECMEDGAFGISSGFGYPPSSYATTDEMIELCKVVARYNGIYTSHIRDHADGILQAAKEAVEIGEKAGLPVEISHYRPEGRTNWDKDGKCKAIVESARDEGVEVTFDVYPYLAGECSITYIGIIPPWAQEGGREKLVERLKDSNVRERIKKEAKVGGGGMKDCVVKVSTWDDVQVTYVKKNKILQGKKITEIAEERGVKDPYDVVFDLIIEEEAVNLCVKILNEQVISNSIKHPLSLIGSDSKSFAPYGVLGKSRPHPRCYGTFPRVLGKYVREERVLRLEDAIRKMSSLPAQKLGVRDRGLLREGFQADILIIDPQTIKDRATFTDPHQYPEGIKNVLVNGRAVVANSRHTGVSSGQILTRK